MSNDNTNIPTIQLISTVANSGSPSITIPRYLPLRIPLKRFDSADYELAKQAKGNKKSSDNVENSSSPNVAAQVVMTLLELAIQLDLKIENILYIIRKKLRPIFEYKHLKDMQLNAFLDQLVNVLNKKSGQELASLLSISRINVHVDLARLSISQVQQFCQTKLARFNTLGEVLIGIIQARKQLEIQEHEQAYTYQIAAVIQFMEVLRNETNWIVPLLHTLTLDTRLIAMQADHFISSKTGEESHDNLRGAEQHLKKGFAMVVNDRAPAEHNKKMGCLFIVNQLFKIYFKLNTIHLCRNLIRVVEGPGFPDFERFTKRDKVTYQYYVGRISMFEDQYHKAEICLDYAWKHCHLLKTRNKRMILQFLVPVKLLLGVMPSRQLIEEHALEEYTGLTDAITHGNLKLFNDYLEKYQHQFIQQGVYLLIEKLRLIVQRNLVKKVYLVCQSHQLRLADIKFTMELVTKKLVEMDEVECCMTNLIFKGYMKGYMSHQKKILVVSKKDPFPAITDISS